MYKFILTLLSMLLISVSFGQSKKKQKVIEPALEEVCTCMKTIDKKGDVTSEVEACIQEGMFKNLADVADFYGLDLSDLAEEDAYQMGVEFGKDLLQYCPEFVTLSVLMAEQDGNLNAKQMQDEANSTNLEISGKIRTIVLADFMIITLDEETGLSDEYLIVNNFDGAYQIISNPKAHEAREVVVTYSEREVFRKQSGTFQRSNVIEYISFK